MIRRYQKGSVRKKNGNYVLRYREDFLKPDGSRGRQQCSTILGPISAFRGKKDARRAADEIMREVNQNTPRPQASITLGDFWDRHFKPNIVEKMKRNTRQMYQDRWRKQIAPALSRERMRNVTTLDLDRLMTQLQQQGYSWQTRVHIRNVISKMYSTAASFRLGSVDLPPTYGALDLDRAARQIDIFARQVPIPPMLMEVLRLHLRNVRPLSGTNLTKPLVANWLFPSTAGTPVSDRNLINRHVYPVSKRLGIPHFSWHSLRHTFSTLGGNEGTIPTLVMKQLLGHSKLSTTEKYMHELESQQREAMTKIENLIWFPKKRASGQ
jgi:site-specific recombinase XerD